MPNQQTSTDIVSEQPKSSCFTKHYPRVPYTYTEEAFEQCCETCDRPGLGSKDYQGGNMRDCPLCCIPCTIVVDVLYCIPRIFGWCLYERV
jgi:hypothetical protein